METVGQKKKIITLKTEPSEKEKNKSIIDKGPSTKNHKGSNIPRKAGKHRVPFHSQTPGRNWGEKTKGSIPWPKNGGSQIVEENNNEAIGGRG